MIVLEGTEALEISASVAGTVHWHASWAQLSGVGFDAAASDNGSLTTASSVVVVQGITAKQMQVKFLSASNQGSAAQTITVQVDIAGTNRVLFAAVVGAGEVLQYVDTAGFMVLDSAGRRRTAATQDTGSTGFPAAFYKAGTAPEAAGQWYSWAKDSGNPGAWAPGTPGINGRATDGTTASDAGCLRIANATTGANYLTKFAGATSEACHPHLFDVLWVNSGIAVTTTTAQAIAPVALPSRDVAGSINGEGCWVGLLVTTDTTNAGVVTNTTISYTNSSGTAAKTATIDAFPATAVAGTVVWFQLAAGDVGVKSVQSITLGTSYGGGAVSLIVARPLESFPSILANVGGVNLPAQNPGVRLYDGTCALPIGLMAATTATVITGLATIMER